MRLGRVGQRVAALDDPGAGHPSAAPDHRRSFVVTAPDVAAARGDAVDAVVRRPAPEDGVAVPARRAQPGDVAAGPTTAPRSPSASSAYSRRTCGITSAMCRRVDTRCRGRGVIGVVADGGQQHGAGSRCGGCCQQAVVLRGPRLGSRWMRLLVEDAVGAEVAALRAVSRIPQIDRCVRIARLLVCWDANPVRPR